MKRYKSGQFLVCRVILENGKKMWAVLRDGVDVGHEKTFNKAVWVCLNWDKL